MWVPDMHEESFHFLCSSEPSLDVCGRKGFMFEHWTSLNSNTLNIQYHSTTLQKWVQISAPRNRDDEMWDLLCQPALQSKTLKGFCERLIQGAGGFLKIVGQGGLHEPHSSTNKNQNPQTCMSKNTIPTIQDIRELEEQMYQHRPCQQGE